MNQNNPQSPPMLSHSREAMKALAHALLKTKVDKDVPQPKRTYLSDKFKVPFPALDVNNGAFPAMRVGDSFFLPTQNVDGNRYCAAAKYNGNDGKQYSGRAMKEDGVEGVRVWRTT